MYKAFGIFFARRRTHFARLLLLVTIACFTGCTVPLGDHPYNESRLLAAAMEKETVFVIDVRTAVEYRHGHIPGAVNIPHYEIEDRLNEIPKDRDIIVYCRSSHRVRRAIKILKENGFAVYNFGSLGRWEGEIVK
jgi:rhodanese-related sulfurtransferase